jgi:predicted O-linked N-acetylglucosamine transferase (SPINDLY family)
MTPIAESLSLAHQHHQAGRLDQAETLCRQILQAEPDHPETLHLLGVVEYQLGRHAAAVQYISRALTLNPANPEYHNNLGEAYRAQRRFDAAVTHFRQALALKPTFAEGYYNLALALHEQQGLEEAVTYYQKAIEVRPAYAEAHNNLGVALQAQGQLEEAMVHYRQALLIDPKHIEAHNNLGLALQCSGKLEEAIEQYRRVLTLRPDYAEANFNLGNTLANQGRLDQAIDHYRQALSLKPSHAETHNNLGNALQAHGSLEEAIGHYQQALTLKPEYAEAHNNLASALKDLGKLEEAIARIHQALALKPAFPEAYSNLGIVLRDQGQPERAVACFRQALVLKPNLPEVHSNLIFAMTYHQGYAPEEIGRAHQNWDERQARPLASQLKPHTNERNSNRRLRVGYVSGDFVSHSVSYFFEPLLAAHDRAQVEVFCYSNGVCVDPVTVRLRHLAHAWRQITAMGDDAVAELIRADRIDILVDLSGHTAGNRLMVFARKPAPVQVTYLGYATTTGLSAMDYRLTDWFLSPPDSPEWSSEELIRLEPSCHCYRPPADAPPVAPLPAITIGHVTFGSFNSLAKLTTPVIGVWAQILHALPQACLILKDRTLADSAQRQRYLDLFEQHGIGGNRITLLPRAPIHGDHLAVYGHIDLGLDPFPYNGCTSTCESLWMGVPVITLAGVMSYSRYGLSLLSTLGLDDLVTTTPEAYVAKAVELATQPNVLARLRATLRSRMAASPLCDNITFARNVDRAYRLMWHRWSCRTPYLGS